MLRRAAAARPRERLSYRSAGSAGSLFSWLEKLTDRGFGRADFLVGLLAEHAEDVGEPYIRHLGGKVRELRFHQLRQQTRVTYWLAPGAG